MPAAERLGLYVQRVRETLDLPLIRKEGLEVNLSLNWRKAQGGTLELRQPDENDLRSFLLTFRQFYMNEEPVYYQNVYNACYQCLTSEELRGYLADSRKAWVEALATGGMTLTIDGREITPEHALKLWLYGYYFHSGADMMAELRKLVPHEHMLIRHRFLNCVVDAFRQVWYTASIITIADREGLLDPSRARY